MNTIKNPRMQTPISLLFAAALLLAFAACGGGQSDGSEDREIEHADSTAASTSDKLVINFPAPYVKKKELECAAKEFKKMVHYSTTTTHDTLKPKTFQFTVESYEAIVAGFVGIECTKDPGLAIHFGYDPNGKMLSLAFSFVCMDLTNDSGVYSVPKSPLYTLDTNHKLVDTTYANLDAWRAEPGKKFQDNIVVDTNDDKKFQFIYAHVFSHMVYKLDQIHALIKDNNLGPNDWIEIVPVAEPRKWLPSGKGVGFALGTCLVAKDSSGQLINDDDPDANALFKNHGSDLGSLCPPMCDNVAVFTATGIDVRAICK